MTENTASRTELLDSILHHNVKRVALGGLCGILAGAVMLFLTTLFTPAGAGSLWWLQLTASPCYLGEATRLTASTSVYLAGAVWHFGISFLLGVIFGKLTTSACVGRLAIYGLVLGGLCWLASNMFAPDIFNIVALDSVKQWSRMFLFQSFALSLAVLMALVSDKGNKENRA